MGRKKVVKKPKEKEEAKPEEVKPIKSSALTAARRWVKELEDVSAFLELHQIHRTGKLQLLLEQAKKEVAKLEKL